MKPYHNMSVANRNASHTYIHIYLRYGHLSFVNCLHLLSSTCRVLAYTMYTRIMTPALLLEPIRGMDARSMAINVR